MDPVLRFLVASLATAFLAAVPARSAEVCTDLKHVLRLAQNGVTDPIPTGAESCASSRTGSGEVAIHCAWAFPYREHRATEMFEALARSVSDCLGAETEPIPDLGVNHPDSYYLHHFRVADATLAVSMKDKAALGKTYIFIRAERYR